MKTSSLRGCRLHSIRDKRICYVLYYEYFGLFSSFCKDKRIHSYCKLNNWLTMLNYIFYNQTASPLMAGVPLRAEARRTRSRSRARIESQLIRRVDQIPSVHNAVEYLLSTYSIIKVGQIYDLAIFYVSLAIGVSLKRSVLGASTCSN
jgi:hypothetical protein